MTSAHIMEIAVSSKGDVITISSRWEIQSQAFHDQRLDNQLQTYRYNQLDNQTQATAHPVVSYNEPAVAMYQSQATALCISSRHGIQSPESRCSGELQSRRKISSRSDDSAAKQLTIYESWMSTAELNSNGENDKKPAKEKDTSTIPCRDAITKLVDEFKKYDLAKAEILYIAILRPSSVVEVFTILEECDARVDDRIDELVETFMQVLPPHPSPQAESMEEIAEDKS
ncbi:hypothetical protein F511_20939 [Dorcoceras hygrometricum]|uniref:DNA-directed RNA polymerase III subunit RPC9 n=1 Tax=Dorcoceras hygrometricum TaxID=472368 RepID=A0A2Z7BL40_9LAMI|nr:hypothetical protein F511_20939 [Dorcoceras hygrometricum]